MRRSDNDFATYGFGASAVNNAHDAERPMAARCSLFSRRAACHSSRAMETPGADTPTFVVHSLAHARAAAAAAAAAGRPVRLRSAPGAAGYAGVGWFLALVGAAREAVPDARIDGVLDCGSDLALAIEAIAAGAGRIAFTGEAAARDKIADIAATAGTALDAGGGAALDLRHTPDPATACRNFLA